MSRIQHMLYFIDVHVALDYPVCFMKANRKLKLSVLRLIVLRVMLFKMLSFCYLRYDRHWSCLCVALIRAAVEFIELYLIS